MGAHNRMTWCRQRCEDRVAEEGAFRLRTGEWKEGRGGEREPEGIPCWRSSMPKRQGKAWLLSKRVFQTLKPVASPNTMEEKNTQKENCTSEVSWKLKYVDNLCVLQEPLTFSFHAEPIDVKLWNGTPPASLGISYLLKWGGIDGYATVSLYCVAQSIIMHFIN